MLQADNIDAGYGGRQILFGASVSVADGQTVALIGPNGAGKSTMIKVVAGIIPRWRGDIGFDGQPITARSGNGPVDVRTGQMAVVPQGNRVFRGLSVAENILIGGVHLEHETARSRLDETLSIFPTLATRLNREAGSLSGGEQQMVAVARAFMSRPRLMLLDEPSLGLAPKVLADVYQILGEIRVKTGISILLVEQKVEVALAFCDYVYGFKLGRVVTSGVSTNFRGDAGRERLRELFL